MSKRLETIIACVWIVVLLTTVSVACVYAYKSGKTVTTSGRVYYRNELNKHPNTDNTDTTVNSASYYVDYRGIKTPILDEVPEGSTCERVFNMLICSSN